MYFYFLLKKKINSVNFNPLRSFKRQQLIKNIPLFLKKKQHVSFVALYDGIIRMSQRVITCVQFLNIDTNYRCCEKKMVMATNGDDLILN